MTTKFLSQSSTAGCDCSQESMNIHIIEKLEEHKESQYSRQCRRDASILYNSKASPVVSSFREAKNWPKDSALC